MMRWPAKMRVIGAFFCGVVFAFAVSAVFFSRNSAYLPTAPTALPVSFDIIRNLSGTSCVPLPCIINGDRERPVECQRIREDVYIPFTFVEKYFEVTGKLDTEKKAGKGERIFNWQHSYAKLIHPKLPYLPDGIFMAFDNYNVEVRDRVKCISAIEGVPLSSQWSESGHFYPIQVSQFGLSHYSKNISEEPPRRTVIADFERNHDLGVPPDCFASRVEDSDKNSWVLNFSAPGSLSEPGVSLTALPDTGEPYILFSVKFPKTGSVTLKLEVQEKKSAKYEIVYMCSNETIWTRGSRIFYGLRCGAGWQRLVRDVYIDLVKGLSLGVKRSNKKDKFRLNITRMRIVEVVLHGQGYLDDVVFSSTAHAELFYDAAQWLVRHQDSAGGWPISVKRRLGSAELKPGWYSAMAQGQAMSTLVRAYRRSGKEKYLDAAVHALDLFKRSATDGGITAVFMEKYVWYEEYPTTPASFVLNGFIYALLGLYDVSLTATGDAQLRSRELFSDGVQSLKALLPLYDTGSGSSYDLRHFTLKSVPNIARWDYHSTHVTQLMVMNSIHADEIFQTFAQRWSDYMRGKRADHN